MKYDHLSTDKLWDLVYETAKNRKKYKRRWEELMSPEYAETILYIASGHLNRLDQDIATMESTGLSNIPGNIERKKKARAFIAKIRNLAINAIETEKQKNKNIRRYADIADCMEYIAYLKDAISDLRDELDVDYIDFPICVTIERYKNGVEDQLDDWLESRSRRN